MDTSQARIQGMIGSERVRSLPIMFNTFRLKGRWRPFSLKVLSAAYEVDQVILLLSAQLAQRLFLRKRNLLL